jgi:hypothetical protein
VVSVREKLKVIDGERMTFTGKIERYGGKGGGKFTILLVDVKHLNGIFITDHLWFNLTKGFKLLRLDPGEYVQFDARVKPYRKGYQGKRKTIDRPVSDDYKLSHPTKIKRAIPTSNPRKQNA